MSDLRGLGALLRRGALWSSRHGFLSTVDKASAYLTDRRAPPARSYEKWLRSRPAGSQPVGSSRISVLVPVRDGRPELLDALVRSIRAGRHARWELVLSDDGSTSQPTLRRLEDLAAGDPRIVLTRAARSRGIVAATRAAAESARGEALLFADQDDVLGLGVLGAVASAFDTSPSVELVYTDADQLTEWDQRVLPRFCPGASPWLALGHNYVTHPLAVRRSLHDRLGGLRDGYDGAQDHDLLLRALEQARRVVHVPVVGYHWRRAPGSVAASATHKPWAFEAGRRAVADACRRRGLPVDSVEAGAIPGVSVLVPSPVAPRMVHLVCEDAAGDVVARWVRRLEAPGSPLRPVGTSAGRWPDDGDRPEALLVVSRGVEPDGTALELLARWAAFPGVGAVAASAVAGRRRTHVGHALRRDGRIEPIGAGWPVRAAGPALMASCPREVASVADGLMLVVRPDRALLERLAGRPVDPAGVFALGAAPWCTGGSTLWLPGAHPPLRRGALARPPAAGRLGDDPATRPVLEALPPDVWERGADRFCPRHELLVPLGLPPPPMGTVPAASEPARPDGRNGPPS